MLGSCDLSLLECCVSILQPFEVTNYLCLYNMHEKYLNNLLVRYDDNLITDFFR